MLKMVEDIAKKNAEDKDVSAKLLNIRARFKAKLAERQAATKPKK
jgi:predicted RNA-binding protein with RPS1 domain